MPKNYESNATNGCKLVIACLFWGTVGAFLASMQQDQNNNSKKPIAIGAGIGALTPVLLIGLALFIEKCCQMKNRADGNPFLFDAKKNHLLPQNQLHGSVIGTEMDSARNSLMIV